MAAAIMEKDGTSSSAQKSEKAAEWRQQSFASAQPGSVAPMNQKSSVQVSSTVEQVAYAISSRCNKAKLSAELVTCQSLFVSSLKQQLRLCPEVLTAAFAIESDTAADAVSGEAGEGSALPQVTESRRASRDLASRPGWRHDTSRAPRRAGSQG